MIYMILLSVKVKNKIMRLIPIPIQTVKKII
ncbi:hypothetical protein SAMN05216167_109119 [Spirosoma endophyticum]|uniref:Uncharacterized protein n=1 Tax=Spirosoma endophyticum TaxID=662367 RepID=A0A1I1WZ87_9BACT|nr:hypothetical protein SAMN05216167_109119 [Spirosoma endophyticum]